MSEVWDDSLLADPHAAADKRQRVQRMFAAIAPSYDLNNRLHTLWLDQHWRRKAVELADLKPTDRIVDVACGTGDLTLAFLDGLRFRGAPSTAGQVIGIDFTFEMLPLAVGKWTSAADHAQNANSAQFISGDAQSLPLPDGCCDVVSIAFGIRNVVNPAAAIGEFFRILRPGGRLIILEFSTPTNVFLRGMFNFYFRQILPRTATWMSHDRTGAYKYLPQSVRTFIGREKMQSMITDAGFADPEQHALTFGICICYRAKKNN
jgi:demethylmenaquinone methyltransferase / 2-methoxy-6-polyprenyl-1,4-benzoquinol methylase